MNCVEGNVRVLRQVGEVLVSLDAETYSRPLDLFSGSSIGQHIRHILNFYQTLLESAGESVVDYTRRDRDPRIETDPLFAGEILAGIESGFQELEESRILRVRADFFADDREDRPLVESSVGRELMYVFDHAVHHLAIVKIGLKAVAPGIGVSEDIGVAPSTIKFQKSRFTAH